MFEKLLDPTYIKLTAAFLGAFLGAFFAFIFFVVGEYLKTKNQERKKSISYLLSLKELLLEHILLFNMSSMQLKKIKSNEEMGIEVQSLHRFPLEDNLLNKLGNIKIVTPAIRYLVHIKIVNANLKLINRIIEVLNNFSSIAIIQKREEELSDTIKKNKKDLNKVIDISLEHLNTSQKRIDDLFKEVNWYLSHFESNIFTRTDHYLRSFGCSNYPQCQIHKEEKATKMETSS